MGSIQLGTDSTGATTMLYGSIEGSDMYSTGVDLPRSSYEAVANFAKASVREFSALGICLT